MKPSYDVAVMHDYFVDRLVHVGSLGRFTKMIDGKAGDGGGGIHGISQEEIRGGNAVNLAHALARLGLRTLLVTHSDAANMGLLRRTFEELPVDLLVKPMKAGMTVAFEGNVNVMLGDGGGAADFGPEILDRSDWSAMGRAKVVCSVNWAANRRGTALLGSIKKKLGQGKSVFFDPADFRDRSEEFGVLLMRVSREHLVDWMSMNEEEAKAACAVMGIQVRGILDACRELGKALRVSFDLHAGNSSYRWEGSRMSRSKVRSGRPRRLTGAGDVWDAGSIYGRLAGWDDVRTLSFANEAARMYLESPSPIPPAREDVLRMVGQTTSPASLKRSRSPC